MTDQTTIDEDRQPQQSGRLRRGGLFVNDAELLEILGIPFKEGRQTLAYLDKDKGAHSKFPQKQPLWGHRRYLPAVRKWLDKEMKVIDPARPQLVHSRSA